MRLLAVTPSLNHSEIVRELQSRAPDDLCYVLTIGHRNCDYKASSLLRMTVSKGKRGHIMSSSLFTGSGKILTSAQEFETILQEAVDTLQRASPGHHYRSHRLQHPDEYVHYVCIVADRLADILKQENIDTILFFDIPHLFYDSLLYRIARLLNLRTLILRPSHFPGQFVSMGNISDYGHVTVNSSVQELKFKIEWDSPHDLNYMAGIQQGNQKDIRRGHLTLRAFFHLIAHAVTQDRGMFIRPHRFLYFLRAIHSIMRELPHWRDPFARFFHPDLVEYAKALIRREFSYPVYERPYVYFALHLQPEMTSGVLGERYRDQLLAVEHLSTILPSDWIIYVKDNPKQTSQYRSSIFFHRLDRIRNARWVPAQTSTYDLISNSRFVATISGTVAWEALTFRRRALVFGDAWMQGLPGVTRYTPDLEIRQLIEPFPPDAELESAVARLIGHSHCGSLQRQLERKMTTEEKRQNRLNIGDAILGLLRKEISPTFSR